MNKSKMSAGLLDLIIMVQAKKNLVVKESLFNKTHNIGEQKDWYNESKVYFNSIDNEILKQYGLSKNIISFEKVIDYKVTPEMTTTEEKDLGKFEF